MLLSCSRRQVAEDRRHVSIREEEDGGDDEDEREPGPKHDRPGAKCAEEREKRSDQARPADRVVQERRPSVEPAVLLAPGLIEDLEEAEDAPSR